MYKERGKSLSLLQIKCCSNKEEFSGGSSTKMSNVTDEWRKVKRIKAFISVSSRRAMCVEDCTCTIWWRENEKMDLVRRKC